MSQSFIRVRNPADLNRLVEAISKYKKSIKNTIDETALGAQFSKEENTKQQAPILEGLGEIVKKIDERLAPPELDANGNPILNPNGTIRRKTFADTMNNLINSNATLTKQIKKSITKNTTDILESLQDVLVANRTGLKALANMTNSSITAVVTAVGGISGILNTDPENVIQLLKEIKAELAKKIVTSLGNTTQNFDPQLQQVLSQFSASAGPQDLGGNNRQPPPSSGSASTTTTTTTTATGNEFVNMAANLQQQRTNQEVAALQNITGPPPLPPSGPPPLPPTGLPPPPPPPPGGPRPSIDKNLEKQIEELLSYTDPFLEQFEEKEKQRKSNASTKTTEQPQPVSPEKPVNIGLIAAEKKMKKEQENQELLNSLLLDLEMNPNRPLNSQEQDILRKHKNKQEEQRFDKIKDIVFDQMSHQKGILDEKKERLATLEKEKTKMDEGNNNLNRDFIAARETVKKVQKNNPRNLPVVIEAYKKKLKEREEQTKKYVKTDSEIKELKLEIDQLSKLVRDISNIKVNKTDTEEEVKRKVENILRGNKDNIAEEVENVVIVTDRGSHTVTQPKTKKEPKQDDDDDEVKFIDEGHKLDPRSETEKSEADEKKQKEIRDNAKTNTYEGTFDLVKSRFHDGNQRYTMLGREFEINGNELIEVDNGKRTVISKQLTPVLKSMLKNNGSTIAELIKTDKLKPTVHDLNNLLGIYTKLGITTDKKKQTTENLPPSIKTIKGRNRKWLNLTEEYRNDNFLKLIKKQQDANKTQGGDGLSRRSYHPYKMSPTGEFGKLKIDIPNLNRLMLTVKKGRKRICHQPCSYDLHELLTKRYNNRKRYDPESVELFNKLIKQAELPIESTYSGKFKNIINRKHSGAQFDKLENARLQSPILAGINEIGKALAPPQKGGCACQGEGIQVYSDPDEVANRLDILTAEVAAGNDSDEVKNEISQLTDWLLKNHYITHDDHRLLHKAAGLI